MCLCLYFGNNVYFPSVNCLNRKIQNSRLRELVEDTWNNYDKLLKPFLFVLLCLGERVSDIDCSILCSALSQGCMVVMKLAYTIQVLE